MPVDIDDKVVSLSQDRPMWRALRRWLRLLWIEAAVDCELNAMRDAPYVISWLNQLKSSLLLVACAIVGRSGNEAIGRHKLIDRFPKHGLDHVAVNLAR